MSCRRYEAKDRDEDARVIPHAYALPERNPDVRHGRTKVFTSACALAAMIACVTAEGSAQSSYPRPTPVQNLTNKEISQRLLTTELSSTTSKDPPALPLNTIVDRLMAANARRSTELRGFQGTRWYHLQYHGFLGARDASMEVIATYAAPDQRKFSIVSENGSKLLLNRILLKLLDSEEEAFRNRTQMELSPENYEFDLLGTDHPANACYVLAVKPRKENKFLYRGKIWVDAVDFAVVRMEGQPARSPSFWIKDTEIQSNWERVGNFWFIEHNQSVSHIRMGGMATLTIDYGNYQITGVDHRAAKSPGQTPVLPDPASVTPQH